MQIKEWETGQLRPYPGNPRINEKAVDAVAGSIAKFGFRQPIVVDSEGVIIVGHARWEAAKKLGLREVPVHVANDLDPELTRAYRIADNRTAELSDWDTERLVAELRDLTDNKPLLDGLGFTANELACLLGQPAGLADSDALPERIDQPVIRTGDLWRLGRHALLCGNALVSKDVFRILEGKVTLAITDPPFEMDAYEQAKALRLAAVRTAVVFGGGREIFRLANVEDYRLRFDFVIVYDRGVCLTGKTSLIYRHNRILLLDAETSEPEEGRGFSSGVVIGQGVPFDRDGYASITGTKMSVLQAPVQKAIYGYGKCCDLFRAFVRAMDSDVVYDPFAGSGTGMIAAEIEGKTWRGIEIDPAVADIAVRRWERFTGQKAVRVQG